MKASLMVAEGSIAIGGKRTTIAKNVELRVEPITQQIFGVYILPFLKRPTQLKTWQRKNVDVTHVLLEDGRLKCCCSEEACMNHFSQGLSRALGGQC